MNRRGFTLIELLVAGSLLVALLSVCSYLFRSSTSYLGRGERQIKDLYRMRSELEEIRSLPFEQVAAAASPGVAITPLAVDLYLVQAGQLFTLRSKYD